MIIKRGYVVQMTYDVSDAEKSQAEKALIFFNHTSKLLDLSSDHLNIMKTPFKDNPEMSNKDILDARSSIRRFRDKSIENFNSFKKEAFNCVNVMKEFSTDTQTLKLMKSFISSIDELEIKVNKFSDLFEDLESKDFSKNIVISIEDIQKECDSVAEIIEERIKNHIQTNILATSWVDSISSDLQMQVQEKTPLILDLFNKRQDQLNDIIKDKSSQIGN
jgi:hypothetical protein